MLVSVAHLSAVVFWVTLKSAHVCWFHFCLRRGSEGVYCGECRTGMRSRMVCGTVRSRRFWLWRSIRYCVKSAGLSPRRVWASSEGGGCSPAARRRSTPSLRDGNGGVVNRRVWRLFVLRCLVAVGGVRIEVANPSVYR